jgi:16S rRNA (cytosine967-C5)-methyltransferase
VSDKPKPARKRSVKGVPARRLAVETLITVENDGAYATIALNAAFKRKELSERDRAFVVALVQGTLRHRIELDDKISTFSKQPLEKMPDTLKNTLRIAIFQLDHMEDMPASAVVDTSTELARSLGHQGHAKFCNGLLRNYIRHKQAASDENEDGKHAAELSGGNNEQTGANNGPGGANNGPGGANNEPSGTELTQTASPADFAAPPRALPRRESERTEEGRLSVKYSVPEWLVQRWLKIHGLDDTVKLLEFAQKPPELTVRVCQTAISTEGLENIFRSNGIETRRSELVPSCLMLKSKKHLSPDRLPGYGEGLFTVQDEAAAFVSLAIEPKPNELVIDLCAAPGGKSLHMAEMMDNTGRVVAVDKSASRLNLLKQNRTRLSLTNIEIVAADGREFKLDKLADRVLLDAPCTGTGVLNRRADLRYRKDPVDIEALTELQRQLLTNAASLVKPGGVLVYSTCSIEPEENFDNIRWFMREHPEFEGDDLGSFLPPQMRDECDSTWGGPACKTESEMTTVYMVQLLPSRHGVSGFFVCRLKKKETS